MGRKATLQIDKGVRRHHYEDAFFVFSSMRSRLVLVRRTMSTLPFGGMNLHIYKIVSEQSLNEE